VIIYQSTKANFLDDAFKRDIEAVILGAYKERTGRSVAPSEIRSWKESLLAMAKVLNDATIPGECGVAIEYGIPQTAKRIDFILSGTNDLKREQAIIVELKQWDAVAKTDMDGIVRTRFAGGEQHTSHPSYQAWSYAALIKSFNEAAYESDLALQPCAYLHNCTDGSTLHDPFYAKHNEQAPLFLKGDTERQRLRESIRQHVKHGDRGAIIFQLESGRIRPSKQLAESLLAMMQGKQEFTLIDDQKVVYETALATAKASTPTQKNVVIVDGGPGTGKSVVAINLLVALTGERLVAKYVTKTAAPRAVFESKLTGRYRRGQLANLFSGSGAFTTTEANTFDALVVDEAHRLNEKSGLYGNQGDHQIAEIIDSAKCAIFFLDEDQRVTWKDVGDRAEIERHAARARATVTRLQLASQFRCSGSDGYLAWLDNTLGVRDTANAWLDTSEFDFQVFDSPVALRDAILERNEVNNKARMVAGYCWDWKSKRDARAFDVVIPEYGFQMQWNLTSDGSLWILAPDSVNQIGCIHTCQGLEVDYVGVIVGPDLIVRNRNVVTQPKKRSRHDQSIKGYKKLLKKDPQSASKKADAIIKNTYRTLMTRGMKGCYIYCTDAETADYFRGRLVGAADEVAEDLRVAEDIAAYQVSPKSDGADK
jgi:hypothetical protein